jgi:type IV pilus assembly protein PilF
MSKALLFQLFHRVLVRAGGRAKVFAVCALVCGSFLVLTSLSGCATWNSRESAQLRMRIGTAHLEQGNYPHALRELLAAERLDPRDPTIQNNIGLAYFMRERYDLAARHLGRAVDLDPQFSEARNNYGRVLIELGRHEEAIRQLEKVVEDLTYPDPAKAWINIGLARFRKGDFSAARNDFAQALKVKRDHCVGQTLYGRSLFELQQYEVAAQALDNAVLICRESQFDEPYYFSGLTYYKLGRISSAIARMEEVVRLYPNGNYAPKAESLLKLMR